MQKNCFTGLFKQKNRKMIVSYNKLIEFITSIIPDEVRDKIKGTLKLQIIVYKDGTSCLLSYENETNIKSKNLKIMTVKNLVDSKLVWTNGLENVAALVEIKFKKKGVLLKRLGMDGISGWHELKS